MFLGNHHVEMGNPDSVTLKDRKGLFQDRLPKQMHLVVLILYNWQEVKWGQSTWACATHEPSKSTDLLLTACRGKQGTSLPLQWHVLLTSVMAPHFCLQNSPTGSNWHSC